MAPSRLSRTHAGSPGMLLPPKLNLRKAASYNSQDRGPLSSTSSRFNFNHLLFSPPPSPSLPALVPRKKPQSPTRILSTRPKRAFRVFIYFLGSLLTVYVVATACRSRNVDFRTAPPVASKSANSRVDMVGQDVLPNFPTPILVTDHTGHSKWTVSVPQEYKFPLSIEEYSDLMDQCRDVSEQVQATASKGAFSTQAILGSKKTSKNFVDVYEAEKNNFLPATIRGLTANDAGHFVGVDKASMFGKPVCSTSMTFVLESTDAGLGNTLMLMWTLYGLAKAQRRAFFIDDSHWAYGRYTDMFQPPPVPDCQPPPRHHIIPCPSEARHLAVTAATAKEVFPSLLAQHRRGTSQHHDELREAYELARTGYRAFFALTQHDQDYVDSRVKKIRSRAKPGQSENKAAPIIGLHIRRGDRHPMEYQYKGTYIPIEQFLDQAERTVESYYNGTDKSSNHRAITILASDDPTIHGETGLSAAMPAQERIRLASKEAIKEANANPLELHQLVDETFGWEGGFFAPMFWSLGVEHWNNAANAPLGVKVDNVKKEARHMAPPSQETLKLRSLIGRAYMMDLAVLADASDTVICTVSSMGCRLLGVMKGWEEGLQGGGWINVDGSYGWDGIRW